MTQNKNRDVYLPEGNWYDYWSGKCYEGKQWINDYYDIEKTPFFVREGAILPLGKVVQFTDEIDYKTLNLNVYPNRNGTADYRIIDDETNISMSSISENNKLYVSIDPEPESIHIEIPDELGMQDLFVNDRKN